LQRVTLEQHYVNVLIENKHALINTLISMNFKLSSIDTRVSKLESTLQIQVRRHDDGYSGYMFWRSV